MNIVNIMLSRGSGGAAEVFYNYNAALTELGHEVSIVVRKKSEVEAHLTKTNEDSSKRFSISATAGLTVFYQGLLLRKKLKTLKPDLVVTHSHRRFIRRAASGIAPVVVVTHNYKMNYINTVDAAFVISRDLRDAVINEGMSADRVFLIPNILPAPANMALGAKHRHDPLTIGVMGRFVKKKGFDIFLRSLAILKARGHCFRAIMGGNGPLEQEYIKLAETLGLTANDVEFAGYIGADIKADFFDKLDVLCMPSTNEGFPMVMLESFRHGVPVIATNTEGINEAILDRYNGRLLDDRTPEAFADALAEFLEQPAAFERYRAAAFQKFKDEYSMDALKTAFTKALNEVCHVQ